MEPYIIKKDLDRLINSIKEPISLDSYRMIATYYQMLVEEVIESIWENHNNKINMELNNIKICLGGSAVNTSTAIGYMVEEFLVRQFPTFLKRSLSSTINSPEDALYENDQKIELMINLKVEKNTSSNNGIVAANILQQRYLSNTKPKLYLVLKSKYHLDEINSTLLFNGLESYYLESFINDPTCLNADSRNWSQEFNILSGRIQCPSKEKLKEKSIETIPPYSEIHKFMKGLAENLTKAKNHL